MIYLVTIFIASQCESINYYDGYSPGEVIADVRVILWMISSFGVGLMIFLFARKQEWFKKAASQYIYFSFLPFLVFLFSISDSISKLGNRDFAISICKKSTLKESRVHSVDLSLQEYNLVAQLNSLLPKLPESSSEISVDMFYDRFLDDHEIEIVFTCSSVFEIPNDPDRWARLEIDLKRGLQIVRYYSVGL